MAATSIVGRFDGIMTYTDQTWGSFHCQIESFNLTDDLIWSLAKSLSLNTIELYAIVKFQERRKGGKSTLSLFEVVGTNQRPPLPLPLPPPLPRPEPLYLPIPLPLPLPCCCLSCPPP